MEITAGLYQQAALIGTLIVVVLLIWRSLRGRARDGTSKYDFDDLLLGADGKASKAAHVMFGAFALTSWVIFYLTLEGKITDVMFGAYLVAWVTPTVTALITRGFGNDPTS